MGLNKPSNITGVAVHNELTGRNDADGHPIGAVTGLQVDLDAKATAITNAVNTANTASSTATTANTNATEAETKADSALTKIGDLTTLPTTNKASLVGAITENFTNANNGKTLLASAINGKGGTANDSMTFSQLSDAVTAIPNIDEATGNAVAGDVRAGKTFSTTVGNGITGTLAEKQGDNNAVSSSISGSTLRLLAPAGIYDGVDDRVNIYDADFIAGNIKGGVSLFGLTGSLVDPTFTAGNNIQYRPSASIATSNTTPWQQNGSFTIGRAGTYRVSFKLYLSASASEGCYGRLYNVTTGQQLGSTKFNNTATQTEYSEDITVNAGDVIRPEAYTGTSARNVYLNTVQIKTANPTYFSD